MTYSCSSASSMISPTYSEVYGGRKGSLTIVSTNLSPPSGAMFGVGTRGFAPSAGQIRSSYYEESRQYQSRERGRNRAVLCGFAVVLRGLLVTNLDTIFLHTTHGAIEKEQISRFVGFIYRSIQGIDDLLRGLVIRPSLLIKRHSKCCSHPLAQWVRVLGANQTRSRETARKWCGPKCDHGRFG